MSAYPRPMRSHETRPPARRVWPRTHAALLAAALLLASLPSTSAAADASAAAPPLDQNLLHNAGFNTTPRLGAPIPGWAVTGDVHTETFGTRRFPSKAYGAKYHGGARYLSCYGGRGGSVTQTIEAGGIGDRSYRVRVRLATSLGGVLGHRVRVSILAKGPNERYIQKVRTLEITNHYKKAVTGFTIPRGTTQLVATIRLMPKRGSSACKVMADTSEFVAFR
jgi:hypothetical protein